jgi:hypothetical protein
MPVVWSGVTAEQAGITDPSLLNTTNPPTGAGNTAAEYATEAEVGALAGLAVRVVVDDATATASVMDGDWLGRKADVPAKRAMIDRVPMVRKEVVVQVATPLATVDAPQPGIVTLFALKSTEPLGTPGSVAVKVTGAEATMDGSEVATVTLDT